MHVLVLLVDRVHLLFELCLLDFLGSFHSRHLQVIVVLFFVVADAEELVDLRGFNRSVHDLRLALKRTLQFFQTLQYIRLQIAH